MSKPLPASSFHVAMARSSLLTIAYALNTAPHVCWLMSGRASRYLHRLCESVQQRIAVLVADQRERKQHMHVQGQTSKLFLGAAACCGCCCCCTDCRYTRGFCTND
jgi:hypothetical protein